MNRFKKEVRRRGVRLECDYEMLPSAEGIETVAVSSEKALVSVYHVSAGWTHIRFDRSMKISEWG